MENQYSLDLRQISMDKFRSMLKSKDLLPGRSILLDNIDKRFDMLMDKGINNLFDLNTALKSKLKAEQFAKEIGIDVQYLTVLRREANSYVAKPVSLSSLPFEETNLLDKLVLEGITNSKRLFEKAARKGERAELAEKMGVQPALLLELVQLADLVRIAGVGPVFARLVFDAGIRSASEFLSMAPQELFDCLTSTNEQLEITNSRFSAKDLEYCLEIGRFLPMVLED